MGSGQDAGCEKGCRRSVQGAIGAPGDFVERTQGQTASGQPAVDFRLPERQKTSGNPLSGFDPADLFPQGVHLSWGGRHGWIQLASW